jgi:hypothetical protein
LLNNSGGWFRGVRVRAGPAWSMPPACTVSVREVKPSSPAARHTCASNTRGGLTVSDEGESPGVAGTLKHVNA